MRIEILSFPAAVLATHPPGQIETRMTKRARLRVFPESSRSAVLRSRPQKWLKDQILRLALAAARRASRSLRISPAGSLSAAPRSRPQIGSTFHHRFAARRRQTPEQGFTALGAGYQ